MSGARFAVAGLELDLVARSHGWYDLLPFDWDAEAGRLSFTFLSGGAPVRVAVSRRSGGVAVSSPAPAPVVRPVVSRVLDLGSDLGPFHALCAARRDEGFGWVADRLAGRILRSPSLFEDAVKVLCTTNCSWALTRLMVSRMVEAFDRGGEMVAERDAARLSIEEIEGRRSGSGDLCAFEANQIPLGAFERQRGRLWSLNFRSPRLARGGAAH